MFKEEVEVKKIKNLLIVLAILVLMPLNVFAAEKINVYIFKGEGCGYCAKALTFFEGLDDEYKSYFNLVEKEVWNDENNATQMEKVADYFNEDVGGVPYIIIGEKTFQGFAETYEEDIKEAIKEGYENADGTYKDVVASIIGGVEIKKDDNSAALTIIVIVAFIAGVAFLIYMARDDSSAEAETKEEEKKTTAKKNTQKKKTNKK